jgi:hypothetical protein
MLWLKACMLHTVCLPADRQAVAVIHYLSKFSRLLLASAKSGSRVNACW